MADYDEPASWHLIYQLPVAVVGLCTIAFGYMTDAPDQLRIRPRHRRDPQARPGPHDLGGCRLMKKDTIALALILAACSNGDGRDHHDLEHLVGRTYETGTTEGDNDAALVIDTEPVDNATLRGTIFVLRGQLPTLEVEALIYRDDRFDDVAIIEVISGLPNGWAWSWLKILDGGRVLDYGIPWVATPFLPEPPESMPMAYFWALRFEDTH